MTRLAIIDYGSGNLRSVSKAFAHVAPGMDITITSSLHDIASASHMVLPGVGAYGDCMRGLQALPGMLEAMRAHVFTHRKWFLGICVGMQMLFEEGHEHGVHQGLGWLKGKVVALATHHSPLKIPHMGWNELRITQPHPLLAGVKNGDHAYFVHSYAADGVEPDALLAVTEYGQTIPAIVGRDNLFGTQFHPEKSQETGLRILRNFVELPHGHPR